MHPAPALIAGDHNEDTTAILGRIGGDEFSALMTCSCLDELKVLQIRIREILDEFNARGEKPYKLSISIAQVIYDQGKPRK